MNLQKIFTTSIFLLIFSSLTVFGQIGNSSSFTNVETKTNYQITADSIGDIRLGMTVAEARKAFKKAKFARFFGSEQAILISVSLSGKQIMTLGAGEGAGEDDAYDENGKEKPINENAKIQYIEVLDSRYKTDKGVKVGMRIADAEKKYGKVKSIYNDAHAGEIGEFTDQPESLSFLFAGKRTVTDEYAAAGIYTEDGEGRTDKYNAGAYISSISISNFIEEEEEEEEEEKPARTPEFTSVFTNFTTDCKLVDEEGDNGRFECQTPDSMIYLSSGPVLWKISMGNDFADAKTLYTQSLDSDFQKNKIEWRLVDGMPFAVIIHLYDYNLNEEKTIATKTGLEYFAVKGVNGYSFLDFQIPTDKNSDNAEEARRKADEGIKNARDVSHQYAFNTLILRTVFRSEFRHI